MVDVVSESNEDDFDKDDDVDSTTSNSFVDWKNAPTLTQLKTNLSDANADTQTIVARMNEWLNVLAAPTPVKKAHNGTKVRSRVQPKLVRKNNEWRYPNLSEPFLSNRNLFRITPVTADDTMAAEQNELLLNYQFKSKLPFVAIVDSVVRDYVDLGTVIGKVSWIRQTRKVKEEQKLYAYTPNESQEVIEYYNELFQLQTTEPDSYNKLDESIRAGFEYTVQQESPIPFTAREAGTQTVEVDKVIVNRPHLEVCDYDSVFIDPTCKGILADAKFVVHRTEVSIADLKADSRYKDHMEKLDEIQTNALEQSDAEFITQNSNRTNFTFNDKPRKKVTLYEYWGHWDINSDGTLVAIVAAWVGNTLVRLEENPYPDKAHPFIAAAYLPVRGSVYGEPDAELISDNQNIIGAVTRSAIDTLGRSAANQTGIAKDFLDPANRAKFVAGDDYDFNPTAHPTNSIHQHQFPSLPNTVEYMLQKQQVDAESLTGVKSFGMSGITGEGLGETAASVRTVVDSTAQRTTSILRRLGEFFIEAARKFTALNGEFLSEEEVVRLTNKTFSTVRKDDLRGDFDLDITIATVEADTARANDLGFILQTASATIDPTLTTRILAEICRLRSMPQFAKELEQYQPQPDPVAEAKKEAEVRILQAQAMLLEAQAQEAMAKANLNSAKVSESEAKTGKITAEADGKAIDNMANVSGEKHLQNMDKMQSQQDTQVLLQEQRNQNARDMQQQKLEADANNLIVNTALNKSMHGNGGL